MHTLGTMSDWKWAPVSGDGGAGDAGGTQTQSTAATPVPSPRAMHVLLHDCVGIACHATPLRSRATLKALARHGADMAWMAAAAPRDLPPRVLGIGPDGSGAVTRDAVLSHCGLSLEHLLWCAEYVAGGKV